MTTVGFSFTKINASRNQVSEQNIRIENNIGISNVNEANTFDPKKSLIKFEFTFVCRYEPGLGSIELNGEIIELYEKDFGVKVLDLWSKEKKVHPEILAYVLNNVLSRANIEAIIMSKELGLPSPVQMPKVEVKTKDSTVTKIIEPNKEDTPAEKKEEKKEDKKDFKKK